MSFYSIYLLLCSDKSLYCGITTDLERRFEQHKCGKGGNYTRSHGAVKIVYSEPAKNRSEALKREAAIKRMTREQKRRL